MPSTAEPVLQKPRVLLRHLWLPTQGTVWALCRPQRMGGKAERVNHSCLMPTIHTPKLRADGAGGAPSKGCGNPRLTPVAVLWGFKNVQIVVWLPLKVYFFDARSPEHLPFLDSRCSEAYGLVRTQ